jgi:hypothetical protein
MVLKWSMTSATFRTICPMFTSGSFYSDQGSRCQGLAARELEQPTMPYTGLARVFRESLKTRDQRDRHLLIFSKSLA